MDASSPKTNASTSTPAKAAETVDMGKRTATKVINAPEHGMQPKYLRYNVWDPTSDFTPTTADWTEMATPLSRLPLSELVNPIATKTIREHPDLFKVITQSRLTSSSHTFLLIQTSLLYGRSARVYGRVFGLGWTPPSRITLQSMTRPSPRQQTRARLNS